MKPDVRETVRQLAATAEAAGTSWEEILEASFLIHGHVCGGMPLGFRAGVAALAALGIGREENMAHRVFVETGTGHAAGCFADGVQMGTGCTFGKGLIERTQYGKWALTLVDRDSGKAVRVSVRPEVVQASFQSPFVQQRKKGVPPTEVPLALSKPLVEKLLQRSDAELFSVSEVFDHPLPPRKPATFNLVTCSVCGEAVAENKVRLKDGRQMCIPCSGYGG